jgi:hypothetical protein
MFSANLDVDLRFNLLIAFTFLHFLSILTELNCLFTKKKKKNCAVGKLPASRASSEVLAAYRKEEWAETMKLLEYYVSICQAEKVFFISLSLLLL